jgi:hypothetical protein
VPLLQGSGRNVCGHIYCGSANLETAAKELADSSGSISVITNRLEDGVGIDAIDGVHRNRKAPGGVNDAAPEIVATNDRGKQLGVTTIIASAELKQQRRVVRKLSVSKRGSMASSFERNDALPLAIKHRSLTDGFPRSQTRSRLTACIVTHVSLK